MNPKFLQHAAQIWCDPRLAKTQMDPQLAIVIAEEFEKMDLEYAEHRLAFKEAQMAKQGIPVGTLSNAQEPTESPYRCCGTFKLHDHP